MIDFSGKYMLSRLAVTVSLFTAVVGDKLRFSSGRLHDLCHCISTQGFDS